MQFVGIEKLEDRQLLSANVTAAAVLDASLVSAAWFAELNPGALPSSADRADAGGYQTYDAEHKGDSFTAIVGSWFVQLSDEGLAAAADVASVSDVLMLDGLGATVVRGLGLAGLVQVTTADWVDTQSFVDALESSLYVDYVAPDMLITTQATPNDSQYHKQWALHNTGQSGGTNDADIDAPQAWDVNTGSASVIVGVIDSGVDYTHPDLAANMWRNPGEIAGDGIDNDGNGFVDDVFGYDFVENDGDPMDANGHGTHVAGTIAADGNNGTGIAGVSWSAKIMALRFLDADGSGSSADAIRAINYATMMRTQYGVNVRVTNNSWGGGGYYQPMFAAINASRQADMLFVVAAGNYGVNNDFYPSYPANYTLDNVISVAATDNRDRLASFSQYGRSSVDLGAPGVSILSTVPGGGYASYSGTSMAAPHVAGVVALVWAEDPSASYNQVRDAIYAGADPITALDTKTITGARLNARGALDAINGNAPHPENLDRPVDNEPNPGGGGGGGGGNPAPPSGEPDAYEDNDTRQIVNARPEGAHSSPNLGEVVDLLTIRNLNTLDDDSDWYRFEITDVGSATDEVRIDFLNTQGDLDLALYNAAGVRLGGSTSTSNTESVSLAGLGPGAYYAHVYGYLGAANPNYTLTIDAPGNATELDLEIGDGVDRSIVWTDADGTQAELSVKDGLAALHFTGERLRFGSVDGTTYVSGINVRLETLDVTDSNAKTKVKVKTSGGDNALALDSLTAGGILRAVKLKNVNITGGDIHLGGTRVLQLNNVTGSSISIGDVDADGRSVKIQLNRVKDSSIDSLWEVKKLQLCDWLDTDATEDRITAPTVQKIQAKGDSTLGVAGDFMADLILADTGADFTVKKIQVAGWLRDVTLRSASSVGAVQAVGMENTTLLVGVDPERETPPTSADQFVRAAEIKKIKVSGVDKGSPSFIDSDIAAHTLGKVQLAEIDVTNGGDDFGLHTTAFKKLQYTSPEGLSVKLKPDEIPGVGGLDDDFVVRIL